MKKSDINIWTDGSCYYKTKLGGIGVYIAWENKETFISKGYSHTKTGRMELRAIIEALSLIQTTKIPYNITIHSDSQYVINSVNKGWVYNWEKHGLKLRTNGDLWELLLFQIRRLQNNTIKFKWVKGHSGVLGNEMADRLADYKQFKVYERDIKHYERKLENIKVQ